METLEENPGLTTTKAPFIENAVINGQLFIHQPYELYTEENQRAWQELFKAIQPKWEKFANSKFLEGVKKLGLKPDTIPRLEDINRFLEPLTGFQAKAVSGYVPSHLFFDSLKNRAFPTTITIRDGKNLGYLPEPDIFHDIAGHVPMHTDKVFADILVKFGSLAELAGKRHAHIKNKTEKIEKIRSNIIALSRFFWFSIEFGLMQENDKIVAYGSGLLSSSSELEHSILSKEVKRRPFQMEEVINEPFEIDHFQPLLFIIDSFEHLYREVHRLEEWLLSGKLDRVKPGEPFINPRDLEEFIK